MICGILLASIEYAFKLVNASVPAAIYMTIGWGIVVDCAEIKAGSCRSSVPCRRVCMYDLLYESISQFHSKKNATVQKKKAKSHTSCITSKPLRLLLIHFTQSHDYRSLISATSSLRCSNNLGSQFRQKYLKRCIGSRCRECHARVAPRMTTVAFGALEALSSVVRDAFPRGPLGVETTHRNLHSVNASYFLPQHRELFHH